MAGLRKEQREQLVERIVMVAQKDGEMTVSRIAERFGLSSSAVKRILRGANLDRVFPKGGGCYYENGLA